MADDSSGSAHHPHGPRRRRRTVRRVHAATASAGDACGAARRCLVRLHEVSRCTETLARSAERLSAVHAVVRTGPAFGSDCLWIHVQFRARIRPRWPRHRGERLGAEVHPRDARGLSAGLCASTWRDDDQTGMGSCMTEANAPAVPRPPWPKGDERGMANTLGPGTWARCAPHLGAPGARCYELSHEITNTMPSSPFSAPLKLQPRPTRGMRNAVHASNMETLTGDQGAQGTHMDALGHFGAVDKPWDGTGEFPVEQAFYYGGFRQREVKPDPSSMLEKLGIDKVPPMITTAVLLDAKAYYGKSLPPGT